jgi:hypothetical protein
MPAKGSKVSEETRAKMRAARAAESPETKAKRQAGAAKAAAAGRGGGANFRPGGKWHDPAKVAQGSQGFVPKPAKAFTSEYQPSGEAKMAGKERAEQLRDFLDPFLKKAAETWVRNLDSENVQGSNAAAEHIIERLAGKVVQPVSAELSLEALVAASMKKPEPDGTE